MKVSMDIYGDLWFNEEGFNISIYPETVEDMKSGTITWEEASKEILDGDESMP